MSQVDWGSRLRSSCIAEPRRGSRHVLVVGGEEPTPPAQWEGREQQQPLEVGQVEQA